MAISTALAVSATLTSVRGFQVINTVFQAPPGQWTIYLERADGLVLERVNTSRVVIASEKSSRRDLNLCVPYYNNGTARVPYLDVACVLTVETVSGSTSIAVGGTGWTTTSTSG